MILNRAQWRLRNDTWRELKKAVYEARRQINLQRLTISISVDSCTKTGFNMKIGIKLQYMWRHVHTCTQIKIKTWRFPFRRLPCRGVADCSTHIRACIVLNAFSSVMYAELPMLCATSNTGAMTSVNCVRSSTHDGKDVKVMNSQSTIRFSRLHAAVSWLEVSETIAALKIMAMPILLSLKIVDEYISIKITTLCARAKHMSSKMFQLRLHFTTATVTA